MREQMTPQSLVQAYNKFVYQKKAGQYYLPAFSVTNFCWLCSSGSICLGSCCYGPRNVKTQLSIKDSFEIQEKCPSSALGLLRDSSSASIPGLHRDPSSASSTLTAIEKTPVYNKGIQYSPIIVDLCPTVLKKKKKRSQRGRKTPVEKLTFHCSTEAYNLKTLLSILKGNKKQHKKQMFSTASVGLAQVTSYSLLKKLRSSEAPCPCKRKKNKPVKPVPLSKKLTKISDSSIEEIILRNYIDSWYPLLLKKISQLQSSESWPLPLSNSKTSNDTAVLEGGGGSNERGGKRSNSGRKKGSVSTLKDVNLVSPSPLVHSLLSRPSVFYTIGCHPHFATYLLSSHKFAQFELLVENAGAKCVAIGECGIDTSKKNKVRLSEQVLTFKRQVQLAMKYEKPLVLHIRGAEKEAIEALDEVGLPKDWPIHRYFVICRSPLPL